MFTKNSTKLSIQVLEKCAPLIIINKSALAKMKVYIDECDDEVGWLGTATKEEDFFHIKDVFLFDQEVHSTTTEITPEGLSEFGEEILQQDDGMEIWNDLKVWGHSHVNMSVSPSGQDDSQMEVFADNGHDFSIRIIANKKGDMAVDLYDYETGVIYNNIGWYANKTEQELAIEEEIGKLESTIEALYGVLEELDDKRIEELEEDIVKEMKVKVRKKGYAVTTYNQGYYKNWHQNQAPIAVPKADTKKKEEVGEPTEDKLYTYGIDEYTLMELALCLDIDEAIDTLIYNGYYGSLTEEELAVLMNDLKNSDKYANENIYIGGGYYDIGFN